MNEKKFEELKAKMNYVVDKNNWESHHTEEDLAMAISIEVGELLENYLWKKENYSSQNVKEEIADIYIYLLFLCDEIGLDLLEIANEKMDKNLKRFIKE